MLGLKVEENVSIPRIEGADEEERFIRERISRFNVFIGRRESTDELDKHQGFFGFSLRKLKIEFLEDNDPFRIFSPSTWRVKTWYMGLEFAITMVVRNKM